MLFLSGNKAFYILFSKVFIFLSTLYTVDAKVFRQFAKIIFENTVCKTYSLYLSERATL